MKFVGIFLFIALIFGFGLLYLVFKSGSTKKSSKLDKKVVQDKWREIETLINQGNPNAFSSAVMAADKLFDHVLKGIVSKGDTQHMGERLKLAQNKFSDYQIYQGIWSAHKVRNNIAHEINHELHSSEAKKAIDQFRRGLKDLRVI